MQKRVEQIAIQQISLWMENYHSVAKTEDEKAYCLEQASEWLDRFAPEKELE